MAAAIEPAVSFLASRVAGASNVRFPSKAAEELE
jgi:hypothetical protein